MSFPTHCGRRTVGILQDPRTRRVGSGSVVLRRYARRPRPLTTKTIRRLSLSVSRCCGLQSLLRSESRGPTVLFYHGVEENIIDPEVQLLHMPLRVFEKQIAFLRRHREIISMDHLHECIVNRHGLESRQVVLTFDDGYKNNLSIVAPLMKAWNLPFTIFVSTRHISDC